MVANALNKIIHYFKDRGLQVVFWKKYTVFKKNDVWNRSW